MRDIKIQDDKLIKLIEERDAISKRVDGEDGLNTKIIALDKERTKEAYKMSKVKEKITDIIINQKIEKDEFEEWGILMIKEGVPTLEIYDKVEEYKEMIREQKAKKEVVV